MALGGWLRGAIALSASVGSDSASFDKRTNDSNGAEKCEGEVVESWRGTRQLVGVEGSVSKVQRVETVCESDMGGQRRQQKLRNTLILMSVR